MAREYFPMFHSYLKKTEKLKDAELGRLVRALLVYSATGETTELPTEREQVHFEYISADIDMANESYQRKCETLKANASKSKRIEANRDELKQIEPISVQSNQIKSNQNKINVTPPISPSCEGDAPKQKHRHGKYNHVLLTDDEYSRLGAEFDNAEEAIAYLDEYIELKGYKAKNHNLALRKWVFDALREQKIKNAEREKRESKVKEEHKRLDFDLESIFEKPKGV